MGRMGTHVHGVAESHRTDQLTHTPIVDEQRC